MSINEEIRVLLDPETQNFAEDSGRNITYRESRICKSSDSEDNNSYSSNSDLPEPGQYYEVDFNKNWSNNKNGWIQVPLPGQKVNLKSSSSISKYPKEKRKTIIALILCICSFLINAISIALTHDRVPDRDKVPPLPDAILDNIHIIPELMRVPDVLVFITILACVTTILLHKHKWIVARRVFFILSILYLMRSVTIYITVLPIANSTVYCSPKANSTSLSNVVHRVSDLLIGGGMQISGRKTACGDYIYSGHTAILVTGYLVLLEYLPRKFRWIQWTSFFITWLGMGILLVARGHYTIDVLIGYYAATRMFWIYHSMANNPNMKIKSKNNYHSNVWWFRIFGYFEGNIKARIPNQFSNPLRNVAWVLRR